MAMMVLMMMEDGNGDEGGSGATASPLPIQSPQSLQRSKLSFITLNSISYDDDTLFCTVTGVLTYFPWEIHRANRSRLNLFL